MNCPVCDYKITSKKIHQCPQCHADLKAVKALYHLQQLGERYKFIIVFMACILAAVLFVVATKNVIVVAQHDQSAIDAEQAEAARYTKKLERDIAEQEVIIKVLREEAAQLKATMESSFNDVRQGNDIMHVVQEGETLWSISEMYLGSGDEHLVIADQNGVENIDDIKVGQTIVIKRVKNEEESQ